MKRPAVFIGTLTLSIVAVIGTIATTQAATAATTPRAAVEMVRPAITNGQFSFYTEEQIGEAWAAVTKNFSKPLPEGYAFPATFPGLEAEVKDKGRALFEAPLPDMVAAQYWRCSWLDSRINQSGAARSSAIEVSSAVGSYSLLPSVASHDLTGYTPEVLASLAKELGLPDADHALFALDCNGFER